MKKLVSLFSFIVVLGLLLSACGGGGAPATSAPAATEPAATEVEATEPAATEATAPEATLKIWADDTRTPILNGLADEFLAEYNVELVVEDLGRVQVESKSPRNRQGCERIE